MTVLESVYGEVQTDCLYKADCFVFKRLKLCIHGLYTFIVDLQTISYSTTLQPRLHQILQVLWFIPLILYCNDTQESISPANIYILLDFSKILTAILCLCKENQQDARFIFN
jgi:hypothetical protein